MTPDGSPETALDLDPHASATRRRTARVFVLAAALLGLAFSFALAPWMGEDEPWHLEYARHVAAGYTPWGGVRMSGATADKPDDRVLMPLSQLQTRRRFKGIPEERIGQTQLEILRSMEDHHFYERVDWAGVERDRTNFDQVAPGFSATPQPPLYYLLTGGLLALVPSDDVLVQLRVARGLSWLLFVAFAWVVLAFAREVFEDDRLALCAAAVAVFLPMSARQAAVVNNDVLAKLLAAVVFLIAARWIRGRARPIHLALAVLVCGLGLVTKATSASAVVAIIAALLLRSDKVARRGSKLVFGAGLVLVVGVAVGMWLTQHNTVLPRSLVGFLTRLETGLSLDNLATTGRTLVSSFGWESRFLPGFVNVLLGLVTAIGLVSAGLALRRGRLDASRAVLVLCTIVLVVQVLMLVLRGASRGRYLMPAIPALSALLVAGLVARWPEGSRDRATRLVAGGLITLEAVFLWGGLVTHEYLLWGI